MLCRLRVNRAEDMESEAFPFQLEVIARSAVGGARQTIEDAERFPTAAALVQALHELEIDEELIARAEHMLNDASEKGPWITVGSDLQIAPHLLSRAGFYLHTRDDEG